MVKCITLSICTLKHILVTRPCWHLVVNGGHYFVSYAAQSSADLLNVCIYPAYVLKSVLFNGKWVLLSYLHFLFIFWKVLLKTYLHVLTQLNLAIHRLFILNITFKYRCYCSCRLHLLYLETLFQSISFFVDVSILDEQCYAVKLWLRGILLTMRQFPKLQKLSVFFQAEKIPFKNHAKCIMFH
jgi:hypothetical protein